jgi:hypothetical protein
MAGHGLVGQGQGRPRAPHQGPGGGKEGGEPGAVLRHLAAVVAGATYGLAEPAVTADFQEPAAGHFQALAKEAADMRQALEDRKVIERAKGAIMRRVGVGEDEAFARLRKLSGEQNLKLVEVGRSILAAEEVFSQLDRT